MGTKAADKANKYDRQLRLWGDHGQAALEGVHVCLINATATGTEALKNLILPGIGRFTIIDGNKIEAEDIGNNFFLDAGKIGENRGKVAAELLEELNDDVSGDHVEEDVSNLLESSPDIFRAFSVVAATQLSEKTLVRLGEVLWDLGIPLIVCRSYGLIGYIRLVLAEHTVVESHPDATIDDLRLDRPIAGLTAFCDGIDLDSLDQKAHSHTPWLVLIYKCLERWRAEHDGQVPKIYKEKTAFKEMLKQGIRKTAEGVPEDEENFDEALRSANTALTATTVPSQVSELFEDPKCLNISAESTPFWLMTRALKNYVASEGQGALPLRGTLPDMTSDSERYIRLQRVYKDQAETDMQAFTSHLEAVMTDIGRPQAISENDIKMFCKNAAFIRVVRCRSLADEYGASSANTHDIASGLEEPEDHPAVWYVLLRAANRFSAQHRRLPGQGGSAEADIPDLKGHVSKLLQELGISTPVKDDYIHEMCRYGGSELHSVAAYVGGVAAHEMIKVITRQFVPLNNTYLYNAATQASATLQL